MYIFLFVLWIMCPGVFSLFFASVSHKVIFKIIFARLCCSNIYLHNPSKSNNKYIFSPLSYKAHWNWLMFHIFIYKNVLGYVRRRYLVLISCIILILESVSNYSWCVNIKQAWTPLSTIINVDKGARRNLFSCSYMCERVSVNIMYTIKGNNNQQ